MTRYMYCDNCLLRAVRVLGETYRTNKKKHRKFTVGCYCMNCQTFRIEPNITISHITYSKDFEIPQ